MRRETYKSILKNVIKYGHKSIVIRNFILIMVMVILPLSVIIIGVRNSMERITKQEIQDANDNALFTVSQMLEEILDRIFSFSFYMKNDEKFQYLQVFPAQEVIDGYKELYDEKINFNMLIEEYLDSVYIYIEEQNLVVYKINRDEIGIVELDHMEDCSWIPYYEKLTPDSNYSLGMRVKGEIYPYLLTMVVPMNGTHRGAIITNIDMRRLSQQLGYGDEGEKQLYMISPEGEIYYSNQELLDDPTLIPEWVEEIGNEGVNDTKSLNMKNHVVSTLKGRKFQCNYILITSNEQYNKQVETVKRSTNSIIIVSIILGILVAYLVTIRSVSPMQSIINEVERWSGSVEEKRQGGLSDGEQRYDNEIHYVTELVRRAEKNNIQYHIATKEWMEKLKRAQMVALQSQINPHYLYNTLNMIHWKAVVQLGRDNNVSEMISALSRFFSIGLQRESYLILISEELEHAKLYGEILEARYEGSIRVKWEVKEDILSYQAVRLTLQPLIENAVNHGLRPKRYQGTIFVKGMCVEDIIYLTVGDDGIGMTEDECRAFNYELINHYETENTHIGIRNVNQRIKIMFGDEYGVNLRKNEYGGLNVNMLLPKKE